MNQPPNPKAPLPPSFAKKAPSAPVAPVRPAAPAPMVAPTPTQAIPRPATTTAPAPTPAAPRPIAPTPMAPRVVPTPPPAVKPQSVPQKPSEPEVYTPTDRSGIVKNEIAGMSSFSKDTETLLFETFGSEIMSLFITTSDRIGATYIVLQSTINVFIKKHKLDSINHSVLASDLDAGITNETIVKILGDIDSYYNFFAANEDSFMENAEQFELYAPSEINTKNPEDIILYITSLFKTISALDNSNIIQEKSSQDVDVHTPYESDMINIEKEHVNKMWELAEQDQQSINERNEIIDEIAIPIIKKGFPVDARKLAANFLKESRLNPELAIDALYTNPATFAPILVDKLPRKMFGLMPPNPKDAHEANKSLGRFLKKYVS